MKRVYTSMDARRMPPRHPVRPAMPPTSTMMSPAIQTVRALDFQQSSGRSFDNPDPPTPPPAATPALKKMRMVVSSADRNLQLHPTPSDYTILLDEPVRSVTSITLLNACIPLVAYEVSESNNELTFRVGAEVTSTTVAIPVGDYPDPAHLAAALTAAMNTDSAWDFLVEYVPRLDAYTFSAAVPFTLLFDGGRVAYGPQELEEFSTITPEGMVERVGLTGQQTVSYRKSSSAARILGFGPKDYPSSVAVGPNSQNLERPHALTSAFRRDVSHSRTAVVCVDNADINMSINNLVSRSFFVVGPKQADFEHSLPDRGIAKFFSAPLESLDKIRVRVFDMSGAPYNFNNHDHRIELQITYSPRNQSRPSWGATRI